MTKIQFRRRLIVFILLCVAVTGALMRHYTPVGTIRHDVGTLLMVMWVPIVGNVIAWGVTVFGQWRHRNAPPAPEEAASFDTLERFTPHATIEFTLRAPALPSQNVPMPAGEHRAALVLDTDGFSARWIVPAGEVLRRGQPHTLEVEFLRPALAAPRFRQGEVFRVLMGDSFIADGKVLRAAAP